MRSLVVCLLLVVVTTAYAQILPIQGEIANAVVREGVTESEFIIGIGTAPKDLPNAKELATESALADVYTQISKKVRAIIRANGNMPFQDNVAEHYSTVAQMPVVAVALPRIIEVRLSPSRASDDKSTYAVVAVNRKELIRLYTRKAERVREEIKTTLADSSLGKPERVAIRYLDSYRQYEELKEAELIVVGAQYTPDPREAFKSLYHYTEVEGSQQETINFLDTYFQNVVPVMLNSTKGIATVIATQFEMQRATSLSGNRVQLDPFTYGTTEITTDFSNVLVNALEREMTKEWNTILKANLVSNTSYPYSAIHSLGFGRNVKFRLTGTYWERGNKVTIRATLRNVNTGEFQAVAILRLNKNALKDVRTDRYKPIGYEAIVDQQTDEAKGEIGSAARYQIAAATYIERNGNNASPPIATSGPEFHEGREVPVTTASFVHNSGFKIQIRTDKGFGAQTYTVGEPAEFFVQVNQAAYLRLLYQESGRWTQLAEDQYVKPEQVGQWLEIPGSFVFAEPIGVGRLLVHAQTTSFTPITDFYFKDGYRYIGKHPSDPATLTADQKRAEDLVLLSLIKGPINRNFVKDVARVDSILKGPVNTEYQLFSDKESLPANDFTLKAEASIYLTTVPKN